MKPVKFKTKLKKVGTWTIAVATFDTYKLFGTKKTIRTKGTINGYCYSGISLMPLGDGTHFLPIKKEIRKAIKKDAGDTVKIELQSDTAELQVPVELAEAFEASPEAQKLFKSYSFSQRKYYTEYVSGAKRQETKDKRAVEAVIKLERLYQEKNNG
ncbi:MAG: YdeI/OmpD-associated family protein [Bacteroidota bacterium]